MHLDAAVATPPAGGQAATRPPAVAAKGTAPWRFVVLSDIHVYSDGSIPADALAVVRNVTALHPRFVVITGDSTNGNKGDRFSVRSIDRWWQALHTLLEPLYAARIPVLSVAGNHDTYRVQHRDGYAKAWADQQTYALPFKLRFGRTPFYYSLDVGSVHLVLLDIVTQHIDDTQEKWLEGDLARSNARLKLVFGHVPIQSAITHSVTKFRDKMVGLLAKHGVNSYIAGHEHLLWDDTLEVGPHSLRQLTCGTTSGTYNYGMRPSLVRRHCKETRCTWPNNGYQFRIRLSNRKQWHRTTALVVEVREDVSEIVVHPHYLAADGALKPFTRAPVPATSSP